MTDHDSVPEWVHLADVPPPADPEPEWFQRPGMLAASCLLLACAIAAVVLVVSRG